ncbi:neurosecretory protein VGF [Salarias fasciatus]|uniref:neurosecretory protein VGF n=1 Tax=Salarias fasciatus TaxID=181472 RepID=UPI001176C194|nr:neurosecretory protein VGF-like [Salarias fasciatus]
MSASHHASSARSVLTVLLTAASVLLAAPDPLRPSGEVDALHTDSPARLPGNTERRYEGGRPVSRGQAQEEEEEEEELFKDVDPKQLAAVLLEALNRSQVESRREEEEHEGMKEGAEEQEAYREVDSMARSERDRDGRQELELLMAAHGDEEEERKKALEEEERMTEKVTSRTISQTAQNPPEQRSTGEDVQEEEEEEQLNPEELKSLETMMKEFPRLNTATKREGDPEPGQRESRGYSSHNDINPVSKAGEASRKKLKWQEETQKALHFPLFKGGNFMDDFEDDRDGSNAVQAPPPSQQADMEEAQPEEEEEEEEEELSPEEEEVRAKAEQEEMRRQAAEAQRAKLEEEKLADIASDMLLRYMVKQNHGGRKDGASLSNAMEDKRSDEQQEATEEDDLDPQTIDKLIEISSKLHLPADDVVDIISDVEKKKKKDVPPDAAPRWQRPLPPLPSTFSSAPQAPANQNSLPVSRQPFPAVKLLKSWFQERLPAEPEDQWSRLDKPLSSSNDLWSKPHKHFSVQKDLRPKSPTPFWNGYPFYPYPYPAFYPRRPYPFYPVYYSPPPRAEPQYYPPQPALSAGSFLGKSVGDAYGFPPKRRYQGWVQPRLRKPPSGLQPKSFYPLPLYPRTFQPLPKPRPPSRVPALPPQHRPFYYPSLARNRDYLLSGRQADSSSSREDLEKYIQQLLMNRPQITD